MIITEKTFALLVRNDGLLLVTVSAIYPVVSGIISLINRIDGIRKAAQFGQAIALYGLVSISFSAAAAIQYLWWGLIFFPAAIFLYVLYITVFLNWRSIVSSILELWLFLKLFSVLSAINITYSIAFRLDNILFLAYLIIAITIGLSYVIAGLHLWKKSKSSMFHRLTRNGGS